MLRQWGPEPPCATRHSQSWNPPPSPPIESCNNSVSTIVVGFNLSPHCVVGICRGILQRSWSAVPCFRWSNMGSRMYHGCRQCSTVVMCGAIVSRLMKFPRRMLKGWSSTGSQGPTAPLQSGRMPSADHDVADGKGQAEAPEVNPTHGPGIPRTGRGNRHP